MTRTSLVEQYNNRDVVAQIYRLISLVESSTITSVETERMGDTVTLVLNMFDGTVQRFQFEADGIRNITAVQNGSIETVNILMDSGRTYSFTFNIAIAGMTTDTAQNVTATKTFTAPQVFRGGITGPLQVNGTTVIDGEVQVSNGHSLAVAGDVECANAVNSESAEIGNLAIEPNGNKTVLSNKNGITVNGTTTVNVPTNNPGVRDTKAVNGTRVENSLDAYAPMVRTTGAQDLYGYKKVHEVWNTDFPFRGPYVVLNGFDLANVPAGWYKVFSLPTNRGRFYTQVEIIQWTNNTYSYGHGILHLWFLNEGDTPILKGTGQGAVSVNDYMLVRDSNSGLWYIYVRQKEYRYTALELRRFCDWQRYGTGTTWTNVYDMTTEEEPVASETVEVFKLEAWK